MLALTRKKGEALVINNNIEITVLEIRGDQIKIGISAPKDVPIYRKEVYLQIQQENEAAISADGLDALNNLLDQKKRMIPERVYNLLKNIKLYPFGIFLPENVEIIPEREYYD